VSQLQSETAAEFVAVKWQLQGLINELADQMLEHRSEVSVQMERQKESLEKLTESQLDPIKVNLSK
jgi:translation elongation factor EF-Ts